MVIGAIFAGIVGTSMGSIVGSLYASGKTAATEFLAEQGALPERVGLRFNPGGDCTRAHVVTFLWRAHEKPAAGTRNPFVDVPAGEYYTSAVLWAVSENITNGVDATHFGPDNPCQRGQVVTFLYRDWKD